MVHLCQGFWQSKGFAFAWPMPSPSGLAHKGRLFKEPSQARKEFTLSNGLKEPAEAPKESVYGTA